MSSAPGRYENICWRDSNAAPCSENTEVELERSSAEIDYDGALSSAVHWTDLSIAALPSPHGTVPPTKRGKLSQHSKGASREFDWSGDPFCRMERFLSKCKLCPILLMS